MLEAQQRSSITGINTYHGVSSREKFSHLFSSVYSLLLDTKIKHLTVVRVSRVQCTPPPGEYRKILRRPGCKLRPKPRHLFREIWETCFSSCKKYQFLTSSSQIQFFSFYNIRRCFCLLHVVLQFLCFSLLLVLMIFFNVYYYLSFIILLFNSIFRRSIIYS